MLYRKSLISIFQEFFARLTKFTLWEQGWPLDYSSMNFEIFLIFSWYSLIPEDYKSYVVWQLVRQAIYTMFITNKLCLLLILCFTFGERKTLQNIKNSQNFITMFVVSLSLYQIRIISFDYSRTNAI